jgi:hypothetical protein
MCNLQKRGKAGLVLSFLGVFMVCMSAGKLAYAEGCLPDAAATGTILVDATSSCDALGMVGCSVDSDAGTCIFDGPEGSTTVTIDPNTNSKFDGINWYSSGKYTVNWVIINGAAQGGACGYVYEPGKTQSLGNALGNILGYEKSNGTVQSVNSVEACSKLELPDAKLVVNKTAVIKEPAPAQTLCENGSDLLEIIIDRDPPEGETVRYCYEVSNTGSGDATNVLLVDDNAGIGGSYSLSIGNLPAGASVRSWVDFPTDVNDVLFTERGTYINTATVTGDSDNGPVSATDTATVEAGIAAAQCPDSYQALINSIAVEDPDNAYAASILLQPKNPGLISLCTPTCISDPSQPGYDPDCIATSTRTICEDDCIWDDATNDCKPSGNWDSTNGEVIEPDGRLPYCFEVLESIQSDSGIGLKVKTSQTVEIIELSVNPYVYQTCYKSGGRKVCETICYLYDGESASACPKGSTIYQ